MALIEALRYNNAKRSHVTTVSLNISPVRASVISLAEKGRNKE